MGYWKQYQIARDMGPEFTLYAVSENLGLPLSAEQKRRQQEYEQLFQGEPSDPEVRCEGCGWEGRMSQVITKRTDSDFEVFCPNCGEVNSLQPIQR